MFPTYYISTYIHRLAWEWVTEVQRNQHAMVLHQATDTVSIQPSGIPAGPGVYTEFPHGLDTHPGSKNAIDQKYIRPIPKIKEKYVSQKHLHK